MTKVRSWKEELDEKYARVLEDASYSTDDLDTANEAILEEICKIDKILAKTERGQV